MARNHDGCASGEKKVTKCCGDQNHQHCAQMDLLIRVPHELKQEFLSLLDIAQSQFTEEDVAKFTIEEKKLLAWVRNVLLDGKASSRFATNAEKEKAGRDLARIFSTNTW